jgi:hypothetical protein
LFEYYSIGCFRIGVITKNEIRLGHRVAFERLLDLWLVFYHTTYLQRGECVDRRRQGCVEKRKEGGMLQSQRCGRYRKRVVSDKSDGTGWEGIFFAAGCIFFPEIVEEYAGLIKR